ncbi:MAG: AAA family ATPase [Xanthobacteraceae bacterium]|jgi:predicted ATP-dependent endonuclease of OLD family
MKLRSFRVTMFQSVLDSAEINVDDVTYLVGKNEAGKSALLMAL